MENTILVACDLHDKNLVTHRAVGRGTVTKQTFGNSCSGRKHMLANLKQLSVHLNGAPVFFAYEASGLGFGLYDELTAAGLKCFVLAPSKIARSPKHRYNKDDDKDTAHILELLRGHVLAGNPLPAVWIPDPQTRDDREIVRTRLDAQAKSSRIKTQIRTLLKRNSISKPQNAGAGWTIKFCVWLRTLAACAEPLAAGGRVALSSLLRQLECQEAEVAVLDKEIEKLSKMPRYAPAVQEIHATLKGAGLLTSMVFLTEMGDLNRFKNRRQVGAYLGLTPSSDETGETADRKGHITHQGSPRVRYVLCQAVWNRVRSDAHEKTIYEGIVKKNPKHKKIAVVAIMRRLAVRLWRAGLRARAAAINKIPAAVPQKNGAFKAHWNVALKKKAHAQRKACAIPASRRVTRQCCPAQV